MSSVTISNLKWAVMICLPSIIFSFLMIIELKENKKIIQETTIKQVVREYRQTWTDDEIQNGKIVYTNNGNRKIKITFDGDVKIIK